jgi:cell division protein FtsI/penicillin-binding protein 2
MYSRNNIFSNSNQRNEIKKRAWSLMIILLVLFSFLVWKIVNYMYFKSEPLKTMFNAQYTINEKYGMQYNLLDRNGLDLLEYDVKYYAIIDPLDYSRFNEYTSKYDMQALTITLRNYNKNFDLDSIKDTVNLEKRRYEIDEETYLKLKAIKEVKGFYTYKATEVVHDRYWKIENVLSNPKYNKIDVKEPVFKNADSLEMEIYNKTKNNQYKKIRFDKGFDGAISEGKIIDPINNVNVRLTLDKKIQDKVETILHNKTYEQIGVVLMESSTGKIRAMAQKDDNTYNANLGLPGTGGAYPGSIFKTIVEQAGLDLNLIDKNEIFTVDGSKFRKADKHGKGYKYTLAEAFYDSSNDIFAQIGAKVGLENIYSYAENQGILSKVLNLHYEQNVEVDLSSAVDGNVNLSSIGQKVKITPLQAISIPNTIINKGIYVQPSIIDAYVNDNNEILERITSKTSRVLKIETAATLRHHMIDVVTKGTGEQAYIEDVGIGGKTGTTEDGETSDGWFVGFFNWNEKNYSMVVFVDNIDPKEEEGGNTAAPIFKEIINALKEID